MSNYLDELYQSLNGEEERSFIEQFVGAKDNRDIRNYAAEKLNDLAKRATNAQPTSEDWPFEYTPFDDQKEVFRSTAAHVADPNKPNTGYTLFDDGAVIYQ